jgi:hypothetical protein
MPTEARFLLQFAAYGGETERFEEKMSGWCLKELDLSGFFSHLALLILITS